MHPLYSINARSNRANQGLGLEFVKQLLAFSNTFVIASCRDPNAATELNELQHKANGRLHIVSLDVSDAASVKASAESLKGVLEPRGLDYLINNAAIVSVTRADMNDSLI